MATDQKKNIRRTPLGAFAACAGSAAAWPAWAQRKLRAGNITGTTSQSRPAQVALVLGSGGCRGHAHIGVLRVLEEHGIKPDLIVGSSAGSLVGALYAAGLDVQQLENHAGAMDYRMMHEWTIPRLGIFGGARISRFVEARVGQQSIESLPMRFAAAAADLRTGEVISLDRGDLATAVRASSSAPGLVEAVPISGRLCVDGSLVAPVPVAVAPCLGAHSVIACDVSFPPPEAELSVRCAVSGLLHTYAPLGAGATWRGRCCHSAATTSSSRYEIGDGRIA